MPPRRSTPRKSKTASLEPEHEPASDPVAPRTVEVSAKAPSAHAKPKANGIASSYATLNPKSKADEFFGPWGTLFVTTACPAIAWGLYFACNETTGCTPLTQVGWRTVGDLMWDWPSSAGKWWDWNVTWIALGFYAYLIVCWALLPGPEVEGTLLRDGTKKIYRLNGFHTFFLTLGLVVGFLAQPGGIEKFTYMYDHWIPLVSFSIAFAVVQALWVWAYSFFSGELLALPGNSGNFIYDFFIGRPLNPPIPGFPSFDLKTFNEVRPGIIGWVLLNISCACEQYIRIGQVTDSMWIVLIAQGWYCFDSLWNESGILTQMDITTDGLGFMLTFGNLTWVPMVYTLQARYLAFHPVFLGPLNTALISVLILTGVWIFRSSNSEKFEFRNGRNPKNLTFIETKRGTRLLTSGWWGLSRHPNYFGDWLMALGWCLPTGFNTPITYFYFAFFVVLLLHRQHRDDGHCRHKYGKDWDRYVGLVPWKIIPYVY